MIFRSRKRQQPATAVAEPESSDELFAEIDALTDVNREHRDPATEQRILQLRHRAAAGLTNPDAELPDLPEPDFDALPNGSALPPVRADELTPGLLRAGILRHGCLLVRGVMDEGEARAIITGIERAIESRESFLRTGEWTGDGYYREFIPDPPFMLAEERKWITDGGGIWLADSPRLTFEILGLFQRAGLQRVITQYLGERPAISVNKGTLRKVSPDTIGGWHQDGAFLGDGVRAMNVWVALNRCGDEAPGMDIVPKRIDYIVPTGTEGAIFDWSVAGVKAVEVAGEAGVLRPIFEPGDVLLFDDLFLHTTGADPAMKKDRYAIESWFFGPSGRRDFTINAMMYDPRGNELLDFFGGANDLHNKILRHTTDAFSEDPLRVLRGMQFAARFALTAATETIALSQSIRHTHGELAVERVREEWFKWASRSALPSAGLRFLMQSGWIENYPELEAIIGTPQDPEWHPEGDVFTHTCHCCDALVELPEWKQADEESRIVLSLGILTHDMGKATTTQRVERDGVQRIISPGHEEVGVPIAEAFLNRINTPRHIVERIVSLVRNHMAHLHEVTDRSVRRLARRVAPETIEGLCILMTADAYGRPPKPRRAPAMIGALRERAGALHVQDRAPDPILKGRDLIQLGMTPSPDFGPILDAAYDAQIEGRFFTLDEAFLWLANQPDLPLPADVRASLQR